MIDPQQMFQEKGRRKSFQAKRDPKVSQSLKLLGPLLPCALVPSANGLLCLIDYRERHPDTSSSNLPALRLGLTKDWGISSPAPGSVPIAYYQHIV